jgi:hypothetical protein
LRQLDTLTEIPRAGKACLTAQDPDTGERWRLKGEISHEDWQADPAEREAERGTGHYPTGRRREAETELEAREVEMDKGLPPCHNLSEGWRKSRDDATRSKSSTAPTNSLARASRRRMVS